VAELADAPDLGSGGEILRGSSPLPGMMKIASRHFSLRECVRILVCWTLRPPYPAAATNLVTLPRIVTNVLQSKAFPDEASV
jgi:hypothetical protein